MEGPDRAIPSTEIRKARERTKQPDLDLEEAFRRSCK